MMLLPIDCLCGLLHGFDFSKPDADLRIHQRVLQQIRAHISSTSLIAVLMCFAQHLHSKNAKQRHVAHQCLALVSDASCTFSTVAQHADGPNSQLWLKALQLSKDFSKDCHQVVEIVAGAMQFESDAAVVHCYIDFLFQILVASEDDDEDMPVTAVKKLKSTIGCAVTAVASLLTNRQDLTKYVLTNNLKAAQVIGDLYSQLLSGNLAIEFNGETQTLQIPRASGQAKSLELTPLVCGSLLRLLQILPLPQLESLVGLLFLKGQTQLHQPQTKLTKAEPEPLLNSSCVRWLCHSKQSELAALGASFLSAEEQLDLLCTYGLPIHSAGLVATSAATNLEAVLDYPRLAFLKRRLAFLARQCAPARALLDRLVESDEVQKECKDEDVEMAEQPEAVDASAVPTAASLDEIDGCMTAALRSGNQQAQRAHHQLVLALVVSNVSDDTQTPILQSLSKIPDWDRSTREQALSLLLLLQSGRCSKTEGSQTDDQLLSGLVSKVQWNQSSDTAMANAAAVAGSSITDNETAQDSQVCGLDRLWQALSKDAPAHAPLLLSLFVHHASWKNCFGVVAELLQQPCPRAGLSPQLVLDLITSILWHPNGCAALWRDPNSQQPPAPMVELTSSEIEQLVWWIVEEKAASLQQQQSRMQLLYGTTGIELLVAD